MFMLYLPIDVSNTALSQIVFKDNLEIILSVLFITVNRVGMESAELPHVKGSHKMLILTCLFLYLMNGVSVVYHRTCAMVHGMSTCFAKSVIILNTFSCF